MDFWSVVEIQVLAGGVKAAAATAYDDYNPALSAFYSSCAAGAINGIPYHATYLLDSKSGVKKSNIFNRMEEVTQ